MPPGPLSSHVGALAAGGVADEVLDLAEASHVDLASDTKSEHIISPRERAILRRPRFFFAVPFTSDHMAEAAGARQPKAKNRHEEADEQEDQDDEEEEEEQQEQDQDDSDDEQEEAEADEKDDESEPGAAQPGAHQYDEPEPEAESLASEDDESEYNAARKNKKKKKPQKKKQKTPAGASEPSSTPPSSGCSQGARPSGTAPGDPPPPGTSDAKPRTRSKTVGDGSSGVHPVFGVKELESALRDHEDTVLKAARGPSAFDSFDVDYFRFAFLPCFIRYLAYVFEMSGHHTQLRRNNDLMKAAVQVLLLAALLSDYQKFCFIVS
jgi:flagellar biosynthesis GTPase FlhF